MKHLKSRLIWILRILMVLCMIGILYSSSILFTVNREYAKGDDVYKKVRQNLKWSDTLYDTKTASLLTDSEVSPEERQEELNNEVDFTYLKKINPDVAGWISVEATEMDYPVVRGKDNNFYLDHLFTGERNKMGSIFMDYRNNSDFSDKNTIIYGHNMKNGSMFASLNRYKEQNYYNNYPRMLLNTPFGDFTIELFAGIVVDGNYESIRFDFKDDHDFLKYIDSLKKKSTFESNTIVQGNDRIVTLCTCSYEFGNARYALFGKLI
jgi:sortase B